MNDKTAKKLVPSVIYPRNISEEAKQRHYRSGLQECINPDCRSERLASESGSIMDEDNKEYVIEVNCEDCRWRWDETYKFSGIRPTPYSDEEIEELTEMIELDGEDQDL